MKYWNCGSANVVEERARDRGTLYIVILNYEGAEDTIECIDSLAAAGIPLKSVIVVDNASSGDSIDRILEAHDEISMISNSENLGYAEGNNMGIREALSRGADHVLLLNNDTVVSKGSIDALCRAMSEDGSIGIAGPLVLRYAQPNVVESAGATISWYKASYVSLYKGVCLSQIVDGVESVDYVGGSAILVSRRVWEEVGLLPSHFFLYYEDEDLCIRARRLGFKVVCCHGAHIWHKGSSSVRKNPGLGEYYSMRNRFLISKRHATVTQMYSFLVFFLLPEIVMTSASCLKASGNLGLTRVLARGAVGGLSRFVTEPKCR